MAKYRTNGEQYSCYKHGKVEDKDIRTRSVEGKEYHYCRICKRGRTMVLTDEQRADLWDGDDPNYDPCDDDDFIFVLPKEVYVGIKLPPSSYICRGCGESRMKVEMAESETGEFGVGSTCLACIAKWRSKLGIRT